MKADARQSIQALNDAFRQSLEGGRVALSAAVGALKAAIVAEVIEAVRTFDRFDADNDPHGEHDFGLLDVGGECLCWKIHCYDHSLRWHSPDASDPAVTTRVLTIMRASDYRPAVPRSRSVRRGRSWKAFSTCATRSA